MVAKNSTLFVLVILYIESKNISVSFVAFSSYVDSFACCRLDIEVSKYPLSLRRDYEMRRILETSRKSDQHTVELVLDELIRSFIVRFKRKG